MSTSPATALSGLNKYTNRCPEFYQSKSVNEPTGKVMSVCFTGSIRPLEKETDSIHYLPILYRLRLFYSLNCVKISLFVFEYLAVNITHIHNTRSRQAYI